MALTDKLTAIGNAIRAKTGDTAMLTLDEMPTAIAGISSIDWGYQLEAYSGSYTPITNSIGIKMNNVPSDYIDRVFIILIWATEQSSNVGVNRVIVEPTGINNFSAKSWGNSTNGLDDATYLSSANLFYFSDSGGTVNVFDSEAPMVFSINRDYSYLCVLKA